MQFIFTARPGKRKIWKGRVIYSLEEKTNHEVEKRRARARRDVECYSHLYLYIIVHVHGEQQQVITACSQTSDGGPLRAAGWRLPYRYLRANQEKEVRFEVTRGAKMTEGVTSMKEKPETQSELEVYNPDPDTLYHGSLSMPGPAHR